MKLSEKLEVTALAIKVLPPLIRGMGHHTPVTPIAPGCWTLAWQGWRLGLADDVLLSPMDEALSSLLDVWGAQGKVFFSELDAKPSMATATYRQMHIGAMAGVARLAGSPVARSFTAVRDASA